MHYVTDTHAFLWYLANSPKLSSKARNIFDLCDQGKVTIIISAIVLLECIDVLDKRKIELKFEEEEIVSKIAQDSNFLFSEINLSLIDETIKKFYKRTIW